MRKSGKRLMKLHNYKILIRPEPEGGFTVVVPTLPRGVLPMVKRFLRQKKLSNYILRV